MLVLNEKGEQTLKTLNNEYEIVEKWVPMDKIEDTLPDDLILYREHFLMSLLQRVKIGSYESIEKLFEVYLEVEDMDFSEEEMKEYFDGLEFSQYVKE